MNGSNKAAPYVRGPETRGKSLPYDQKFAGLIRLCSDAQTRGFAKILINWPWIIGDTYQEVIESLSRIADAGLALHIVQRGDDAHVVTPGIEKN